MARDILGDFGPGSDQPQKPVARSGGVMPGETKDVNNYKAPYGPKGIMRGNAVGLGGKNSGNTRQPTSTSVGATDISGSTNHGCCGSQGKY